MQARNGKSLPRMCAGYGMMTEGDALTGYYTRARTQHDANSWSPGGRDMNYVRQALHGSSLVLLPRSEPT